MMQGMALAGMAPGGGPSWDPAVGAALIAGFVAVISWVLNASASSLRDARARRREQFSRAFAATVAYAEFPYVVRRRDAAHAAAERLRISEALRAIQQDLAYFDAWLSSEAPKVGASYARLVAATRKIAGSAIHEAWLAPPAALDEDMNMPDLGLAALAQPRSEYLQEVVKNLRPILGRLGSGSGRETET